MKQSELDAEIRDLLTKRLDGGLDTPQEWLVQAILSHHEDINGSDVDWYLLCARGHLVTTVRKMLRPYTSDAEHIDDPQIVLPGFIRLQKGYIVERDGDRVLVKTQRGRITPAELRQKAKEYRRIGTGCYEHANELDRLAEEWESTGPSGSGD